MSDWWQKWTVERPAAFGDWLWMVFVVQFADFLNRLTLRRVLEIIAITVLALAFIQTFPIDLAFLFAGDTLMYLEIVTLTSLVTANLRVRALLHYFAQSSKNTWNVTANAITESYSGFE
jgi:multisubunit Na+/H+ antiporter MnhG subunit